MERIKQALERARSERIVGAGANVAPLNPAAVESAQAGSVHGGRSAAVSVNYSQTAVHSADLKRLQDHRIVAMADHDPAAAAYKV